MVGSLGPATASIDIIAEPSTMSELQIQSNAEQLAAFIRSEIVRGRWRGLMPGIHRLTQELATTRNATTDALAILERDGVLIGQGSGKRRKIAENVASSPKAMHVAILLYERHDQHLPYMVELQNKIMGEGHTVSIAPKSVVELRMDPKRLAQLVEKHHADAWIVCSASYEILSWFHHQGLTVFAMMGRIRDLPIARTAATKTEAMDEAVERLLDLGHRRISFIVRPQQRLPEPSAWARSFLDALSSRGIMVGKYNLPDWEDSPEGLQAGLDSLFSLTPPTALIVDEPYLFSAVQQHLACKGLIAPRDVSLICSDPDPIFDWHIPTVAHLSWNPAPLIRRAMTWVDKTSRGIEDTRDVTIEAKFVDGATVGVAPKS